MNNEIDQLSQVFRTRQAPPLDPEKLAAMLKENKHPELRKMKVQLLLESVGWAIFLLFFYSAFDGQDRPLYRNVLLAAGCCLLLLHNFLGYRIANRKIYGADLRQSLARYLQKLRSYAITSMVARAVALALLMFYFLPDPEYWQERHFYSLIALPVFISAQLFILWKIWNNRINTVAERYHQLVPPGK